MSGPYDNFTDEAIRLTKLKDDLEGKNQVVEKKPRASKVNKKQEKEEEEDEEEENNEVKVKVEVDVPKKSKVSRTRKSVEV